MIRLTPFDVSTPTGRSKERLRRIVINSGTSLFVRMITAFTALISVPLTVHYLGIERFGLWMTISSVIVLLGFADLGLGNGLVNAVAEANGHDDRLSAQKAVASTFFFLTVIAMLILTVFFVVYPFISWSSVFNVTSDLAIGESGPAMMVFILCFALNLPLGVAQRVQMGYQEGYINTLWQAAGSVFGLLALLLAIKVNASLPWLVLIFGGTPVLVSGLNSAMEFGKRRLWLMPVPQHFLWSVGKTILSGGLLFFVLSVFSLLGLASDNLIIAQVLGAQAVASYAVTQKLFTALQFFNFVSYALWPVFGEALARSDYDWARRAYNRSLLIGIGSAIVTIAPLLLFGQKIIGWWAGPEVVPGVELLVGSAGWFLISTYGSAVSPLLNSRTGLLRKQVIIQLLSAIISIGLKILLAHYWQSSGVIWGGVIGYGIFFVIPTLYLAKGALADPLKVVQQTTDLPYNQ
jgi:O-antigen/teichoic acid export membrane protein